VGIATAIVAGAHGLCFAIASNTASLVVGELVRHGRVRRGSLGVVAQQAPISTALARALNLAQPFGVWVAGLEPHGPAARAGVQQGDLLVAADGRPLTGLDDLLRALGPDSIDKPMKLSVVRGDTKHILTVTPRERRQS
jgi:S1-C subfamily serine protease